MIDSILLFSQTSIFQLKNDLANFSQIWLDARQNYNQQKRVEEFNSS